MRRRQRAKGVEATITTPNLVHDNDGAMRGDSRKQQTTKSLSGMRDMITKGQRGNERK